MTKTTNYQLNQWAKSDRVMMDDFNADNAKIDAALKANADVAAANAQTLAAQAQTIAKLGNCGFYSASYTGAGSALSHTFPHKPMVVMVCEPGIKRSMIFWRGMTLGYHTLTDAYEFTLTWNGNTVKWNYPGSAENGFYKSGKSYEILALLDMEN